MKRSRENIERLLPIVKGRMGRANLSEVHAIKIDLEMSPDSQALLRVRVDTPQREDFWLEFALPFELLKMLSADVAFENASGKLAVTRATDEQGKMQTCWELPDGTAGGM